MARSVLRIPSFPADLDRDAFGHWLSGFTDGEGCFSLYLGRSDGIPYPAARFKIELRADDGAVLALIQSYLGCGRLYQVPRQRPDRPACSFMVGAIGDLFNLVVPHFDRYPLRAKKQADFRVWREAVRLCYQVTLPRLQSSGSRASRQGYWTAAARDSFIILRDALKEQRHFRAKTEIVPLPRPEGQPTLFDDPGGL